MENSLLTSNVMFSTIDEAILSLRAGRFVIVMDSENRENEGDLVLAAHYATPEKLAFLVNHTTGIVCAPLLEDRAKQLGLSPMVSHSTDPNKTAFTISTDSVECTTGVSAKDRATTLRQLADNSYLHPHFRRPGHIFPLIARPGGVLERPGHTEASIDLCRISQLSFIGVIAEMVNPHDGSMMRLSMCKQFAEQYRIPIIHIEQLQNHMKQLQNNIQFSPFNSYIDTPLTNVKLISHCKLPICIEQHGDLGEWKLKCFYSYHDHHHHIALIKGNLQSPPLQKNSSSVLTRIHSQCLTGDLLGSCRCDCRQQLHKALQRINQEGSGLLIYNLADEGRGMQLPFKIKAYHLQETKNLDTFQANVHLGMPEDCRTYKTEVDIIFKLGIKSIRLLTCNPNKILSLKNIIHSVEPLIVEPTHYNAKYIQSKKERILMQVSSFETVENLLGYDLLWKWINISQKDANVGATTNKEIVNQEQVSFSKVSGNSASQGHNLWLNQPSYFSQQSNHHLIKSIPCITLRDMYPNMKVGIVKTMWNETLVTPFCNAVISKLQAKLMENNIVVLLVPGCFEIPYGIQRLNGKQRCDVIICIGVLVKGETLHFEVISHSIASEMLKLQHSLNIPVINSVFNCLSEDQAKERCSPESQLVDSIASTALYMGNIGSISLIDY